MKGNLDTSPWHQRQKPARLSVLTFVLFGTISGAAGFGVGSYLVDKDVRQAINLFEELTVENKVLKDELERLKQQGAILESGSKVDRLSVQKAQERLGEVQSILGKTEEKLAFYQRIMAPEKSNDSLYIQNVRVIPTIGGGHYKFMLTLAQGVGNKRSTKGEYSLVISGKLAGEIKEMRLNDLAEVKKSSQPFKFRYFQTEAWNLVLPDGFAPEKLRVTLKSSTKGVGRVEKEWQWKQLIEEAQ
jgi:hypothetical protein